MLKTVERGAEEKDRILSLQEVAELTSLSKDTIKRRHKDKIVRLSPRRLGMWRSSVLTLGQPA